MLISTPEYNKNLSGVLKNALDWVSRVPGNPWETKPVALMSAAAGRSGGARASYAARLALQPFRPLLLSEELLLAGARKAFDEDFWARPVARFPYSFALLESLTSNNFKYRKVQREFRKLGKPEYFLIFANRDVRLNLIALLNEYASMARAS